MTDAEKNEHPLYETTGGYLKTYKYKEAWQRSWNKASEKDRAKLFELPNFDAEIFKEITGIDVTADAKAESEATMVLCGKEYRVSDIEKALSSINPIEDHEK